MSPGGAVVPDVVELDGSDVVTGEVRPPGDKSISHRALLLSALADGRSAIEGLSQGDDVVATRRCIEALGAHVTASGPTRLVVDGGRERLAPAAATLECGNSGTTMRLLCGVVATVAGRHVLDGDDSLRRRPMDRVAVPLESMGATITGSGTTCTAPLVVLGGPLRALRYELPVASAQVKSAILLAGLAADGPTTVVEPVATRTHTEEMLARAGARIEVSNRPDGRHTTVWASPLTARAWHVPADPSQGAFFVVAALLAAQGDVVVRDVDLSEERTGFLRVLERMDAALSVHRQPGDRGDVVASTSELRAVPDVAAQELPSLDEVPILAVAAAAATGTTTFRDVEELRVKESDRLEAIQRLCVAVGATVTVREGALAITGLGGARAFRRFDFDADGDHRMAMAAAVAATVGNGATVRGFGGVATSYPGFLAALASLL